MRLLLAGDTHADSQHMQNVMMHACRQEADAVFQLGDFGYGFGISQRKGTGEKYCTFTDHVSNFSKLAGGIPVYWLGGNHENYDMLEKQLINGTVLRHSGWEIAPNVFYVPRATMLEFGGVKFLIGGGATSIDRFGLPPEFSWDGEGHPPRKEGESWWPQEAITDADIQRCAEAGPADVFLSHDFPAECKVIDRHLDPAWGNWAQEHVIRSRKRTSEIVLAAGVRQVFHGHLHVRYDEDIELGGRTVTVHGVGRNKQLMRESTYLLDTEAL